MKTPFNMIITGRTCGKTYLLDILEKEYKRHFDCIVLICPTYDYNQSYQEFKYKDERDFIVLQCDQEHVATILKHVSEIYKGTNTLVILHNCASSQDVKNRVSELVKLAFLARHNLSTIVITQQLTRICKPYRENISKLVTFYTQNRNDMKSITDNYLYGVSNDEIKGIVDRLKNNKYARLEINLRHPYGYNVVIPKIN